VTTLRYFLVSTCLFAIAEVLGAFIASGPHVAVLGPLWLPANNLTYSFQHLINNFFIYPTPKKQIMPPLRSKHFKWREVPASRALIKAKPSH